MEKSRLNDMKFVFTRRAVMQMCNRCGGMLQSDTPRDVFDGGTYHVYCGWKLRRAKEEMEAVRSIAPLPETPPNNRE